MIAQLSAKMKVKIDRANVLAIGHQDNLNKPHSHHNDDWMTLFSQESQKLCNILRLFHSILIGEQC